MTIVNSAQLIKRAILSEKTYKQMEGGVYTFLVDKRSTKNQIAKAVENQFQVEVVRVNVLKKAAKAKRVTGTRKTTQIAGGKKASVLLKGGQKIESLSPQKSKAKATKTKNKKESESQRDKETKPENDKKESRSKGLLSKITKRRKEKEEPK